MTEVAVVIGNYQGERLLADCLASLREQTVALAEIVVVDAGSTDAGAEIAARFSARFDVVTNRGLGFLYNRGLAATNSPYVLLSNNDVAFDPDAVELLAAALDDDGSRFAADPTQLDWDRERTIHAGTSFSRGPLLRTPIPGVDVDPRVAASGICETVSANAGAMLVRRSHFDELGGFDEAFFMDFEDVDLCWRAWRRGWPSVYVPDARVRHWVGAATAAAPQQASRRLRSSHYNLMRFALKNFPPEAAARVLVAEAIRCVRMPRTVGGAIARIAKDLMPILAERRRAAPSRATFDRLVPP